MSLLYSSLVLNVGPSFEVPFNKGVGTYLYDENNKGYIDSSGGASAATSLGHGRRDIAKVIYDQSVKCALTPTHVGVTREVFTYSNKFIEYSGFDNSKIWLASSGTDAIEAAIRLSFLYHNTKGTNSKRTIVSFSPSYHGSSVYTLSITGHEKRRSFVDDLDLKVIHLPHPRLSLFNEKFKNSMQEILDNFEASYDIESIAALIFEPTTGASLPGMGFTLSEMELIYKWCKLNDITLIVDEVLTGFGRTGTAFQSSKLASQPDIVAFGKGASGGYYPLSGICVSHRINDRIRDSKAVLPGGHTYACSPVAAALGSKVIDIINEERVHQNVLEVGSVLKKRLFQLKSECSEIYHIAGCGLLYGIYFEKKFNIQELVEVALFNGLILYPGGQGNKLNLHEHIKITPPLTINKQEINELVDLLLLSIKQVKEKK